MTDNLRAPVQGYSAGIPWSLHLRAWDRYAEKYGRSQSAKRLAERGGFGVSELDVFVPGWRDEVSEITRLQEALAAAEAGRWQPIETAPKDGTRILLGNCFSEAERWPVVGYAMPEAVYHLDGRRFPEAGKTGSPTHWMQRPLPAPPSRLLNKEDRNG